MSLSVRRGKRRQPMRADRLAWIAREQRKLWPSFSRRLNPRNWSDYRDRARWLELEALRGYDHVVPESGGLRSFQLATLYARNQRWFQELAMIYGPGTPTELMDRAGVKNPFARPDWYRMYEPGGERETNGHMRAERWRKKRSKKTTRRP